MLSKFNSTTECNRYPSAAMSTARSGVDYNAICFLLWSIKFMFWALNYDDSFACLRFISRNKQYALPSAVLRCICWLECLRIITHLLQQITSIIFVFVSKMCSADLYSSKQWTSQTGRHTAYYNTNSVSHVSIQSFVIWKARWSFLYKSKGRISYATRYFTWHIYTHPCSNSMAFYLNHHWSEGMDLKSYHIFYVDVITYLWPNLHAGLLNSW